MDCSAIVPVADGVELCKNVMIPMRDGVHLAADLYVPAGREPSASYPVVMEYIPYRKDEVSPEGPSHYTYLPRHGYIMARVDIRGTGASEGIYTDEYLLQEQLDGYDAIEWLASQPWCDGHVNMMGISYGGFSSLQVASHNPPHLTSIIPVDFTDDRYTDDCHFRGGLLRKYYDVGFYGGFMVAWNAMPPYPEWSGSRWAEVWEQHLAHNEPSLLKWFRNQTDGPYWRHGSVRDIPETIKCPVFMIGGWRDGYPNPPLRLYQLLRSPRKVLIGPWNHAMPDKAVPGPRIDYLHEVVRWLDYWCKGRDTGIMEEPPVTVFMQHGERPVVDRLESAGEWRAESAWPPPGADEKVLFLDADGGLAAEPGEEGSELLAYEPTVGVTGGLWSGGIQFGLPGDQRPDEALSLVYTSPVLDEKVCILGWPRAILYLSSSASVMGYAASLSDVAPDGSSHLVAKGMLNATRRESFTDPRPLEPGRVYELDIQIDCTGWVFEPGHRIRLSIACADWPNVWPTPELGTSQVYRGRHEPSRLVLPTVPAEGSASPPIFVPSAHSLRRHSDAVCPPEWEVTRDVLTGSTSVRVSAPGSMRINDKTVVERESGTICRVAPDDPAHASARGWHVHRILRPNHVVQGRADVLIQATATHFHISIDLDVQINGAPHFSKRWVETVERQLL